MSYPGAKGQAGVFQRIIGQMPPHEVYVEPFFGSGKIFRTKRRADTNALIDQRGDLLAPFQGEEGVAIHQGDALKYLRAMVNFWSGDGYRNASFGRVLIYCDPPYVLSTRQGRLYYEHEMTDAQHEHLLDVLKSMACYVMISGYPSELYGRELQSWRCISYRTRTRGRTLTECLWCNFPEPTVLHDWRFAGRNHRQRVTFKRLARRWLARLEAMPPLKRGFLLDAIEQRQTLASLQALAINAGNGGEDR